MTTFDSTRRWRSRSVCFGSLLCACTTGEAEPTNVDIDAGADAAQPNGGPDASTDARDGNSEAGTRTCSAEGWCHTDLGSKDHLVGVWGDGTGVAWAIGASLPNGADGSFSGKVYRWDGRTWTLHASFERMAPTGIWGSGPNDIYIAAEHRQGYDWDLGDERKPGVVIHGTGPSSSAIAWTTTRITPETVANAELGGIWGSGPDDVWLVGTRSASSTPRAFVLRLRTAPDGSVETTDEFLAEENASPALPRTLTSVWGTSSNDVWAAGNGTDADGNPQAVVLHRTANADGDAAMWTLAPGTASSRSELAECADGTSIAPGLVAITGRPRDGACAAILVSGSPEWSNVVLPQCQQPRALWAASATSLWAVGAAGLIREWNGNSWRIARTSIDQAPMNIAMNAIWGSGPDDIWVVGNDGTALHKTEVSSP